jgi:hypothetical protein
MGMIVSDKTIRDVQDFERLKSSQDVGQFIILDKEFNKFNEKVKVEIPAGKDIFANVKIVESPKGSQFTAKWIAEGKIIKEETKELAGNQKGVVA